jgi:hypothetical protein
MIASHTHTNQHTSVHLSIHSSFPSTPSPDEYRARYQAHVHRLPPHPKLRDYVLFIPLAVYKFVNRLCDAFGYKVSRQRGKKGGGSILFGLVLGRWWDACACSCVARVGEVR